MGECGPPGGVRAAQGQEGLEPARREGGGAQEAHSRPSDGKHTSRSPHALPLARARALRQPECARIPTRPFTLETHLATIEDFQKLDIRAGRVLEAAALEGARIPAVRMKIDFGPEIGVCQSSARVAELYDPASLVGRLVLGVVNFPPRKVAGYESQVLTLGVYASEKNGAVVLIGPDDALGAVPGDRLG